MASEIEYLEFTEQDYLGLHKLYYLLTQEFDIKLEGTEYERNGVTQYSINKNKGEHRKAIVLLSELLAEEDSLDVEALEWEITEKELEEDTEPEQEPEEMEDREIEPAPEDKIKNPLEEAVKNHSSREAIQGSASD